MNKLLLLGGCMAVALSLLPMEANACGATLFGTGQGTRFQPYRARVAADVLIYASQALASTSSATEPGIQQGLERAGHRITVVSDADALAKALRSSHYDIVIASANDAEAVASQLGGSAADTRILPLVDSSADASALDLSHYAQTLRASAGIGQFLRSINQLMAVKI